MTTVRPFSPFDVSYTSRIACLTAKTGSWPAFTRPYFETYPDDVRRGYRRSQLLSWLDSGVVVEVVELADPTSKRKKVVAGFALWHFPRVERERLAKLPKNRLKAVAKKVVGFVLSSRDRSIDPRRDDQLDTAALALLEELLPQHLELYHIAINPSFQRRGLGKLLFDSGVQIAQRAGWDIGLLAVPEAVNMYKACGCEEILTKKVEHEGSEDSRTPSGAEIVVMTRPCS